MKLAIFSSIFSTLRQFSIRIKLLLASTVLLILPIIGFQYITELETFLREDQQQRLLENARIIASVVGTQKKFQSAFVVDHANPAKEHIFVAPLVSPILLDGFNEDWQYGQQTTKRPREFKSTQTGDANSDPLQYSFITGYKDHHVYLFCKIKDKHIVYQATNSRSINNSDHILIVTEDSHGHRSHYIISTYSPGAIQAKKIIRSGKKSFQYKLFARIKAVWQETANGYNVEIKIPQSILGQKIAIAVIDIDDAKNPKLRDIVVAANHNSIKQLSSIIISEPILNSLIKQLSITQSKTWLININRNVVDASESALENSQDSAEFDSPDNINLSFLQFIEGLIRLVYQTILPQPDQYFLDNPSIASTLVGKDIDLALSGTATTFWRTTKKSDTNILRAVHPIYIDNKIIGAVAVERNSNSILLLQNRAVEILLNTSIIVFLLSTIILIRFASRLSYRIRRLRDETNKAISVDGKIHTDNISSYMLASHKGDEIDDLQRSYADMLLRLGDYNRYLEGMASKLSHELRTPITVVKSSLENIESNQHDDKNNTYIERAKDGVNRLNNILTRMSEATRLEHSLKAEQKQSINLHKIISGCVEGYKIVHGAVKFQLRIMPNPDEEDFVILGCADLIAQLLDKLVSNAIDFSDNRTPILIHLRLDTDNIRLSVVNSGSCLPTQMQANLFESMVSVRDKRSDQPHLGLGLYIVRLIAEFHQASPFADNIEIEEYLSSSEMEKTQRLSETSDEKLFGVEVGVVFRRANA